MANALPHNIRDKSFLAVLDQPATMDVICGRGSTSFNHPGNKAFRQSIADNLEKYGAASDKREKSMIVTAIANKFYFNKDKPCRFIRFCASQKLWYELSYDQVRQKVGQTMRDTLVQQDSQRLSKKKHYRALRVSARQFISAKAKCRISKSVAAPSTQSGEPVEYSELDNPTILAVPHKYIHCLPSILPKGRSFCISDTHLFQGTSNVQHAWQNMNSSGQRLCHDLSSTNLEWVSSVRRALKETNQIKSFSGNGQYYALDSDTASISSIDWFEDCDKMSLSNCDWLESDHGKVWN